MTGAIANIDTDLLQAKKAALDLSELTFVICLFALAQDKV